MQKVLTAAQMREVDRLTTERYGIPSIILMENAAHAVARVITEKLGGSVKGKSILILCGKGNNGGDGAALARILWTQGANCFVHLFGKVSETMGEALTNFDTLKRIDESPNTNGPNANCLVLYENSEFDSLEFIRETDAVIVDALFGTGLSRQVEGELGELLQKFREWKPRLNSTLVSIDIPSGLSSDLEFTAEVAFPADVTVSFTAPKPANVLSPTFRQGGELVVANIGSPPELIHDQPSQLFLADASDSAKWLARTYFTEDSYKNKRGHALVIAGSETYSGAAVLSGNSAIRSGVGLVTLACPAEGKAEIASRILPEVILATLGSKEFDELAQKANAIAVGPGLSATDPATESLVRKLVEERTTPVIVDAGALWFFNRLDGLLQEPARKQGLNTQVDSKALADARASAPLILTPHEGEFMRLLGTDDKETIKDRVQAVRDFATKKNVILVLKGERVLIGHPDGRVVVNATGNSGLGKAGNGDTLTGILAGFCAQAAAMDIDIFQTVVAAVYIAGLAGDIAEKKYGKRVMTASDVRECLSDAFDVVEATN